MQFRAEALYTQLDVLRELRPKAKAAMVAEARRDPAWSVLRMFGKSEGSRRRRGAIRIERVEELIGWPRKHLKERNRT